MLLLRDDLFDLVLQSVFGFLVDRRGFGIRFAGEFFCLGFFEFGLCRARLRALSPCFSGRLRGFGLGDFSGILRLFRGDPGFFRFFARQTNFFARLLSTRGCGVAIGNVTRDQPVSDPEARGRIYLVRRPVMRVAAIPRLSVPAPRIPERMINHHAGRAVPIRIVVRRKYDPRRDNRPIHKPVAAGVISSYDRAAVSNSDAVVHNAGMVVYHPGRVVVVHDHGVIDDEVLLHYYCFRHGFAARVVNDGFTGACFAVAIVMNFGRLDAAILAHDLNFLLATEIVLGDLSRPVFALHFLHLHPAGDA